MSMYSMSTGAGYKPVLGGAAMPFQVMQQSPMPACSHIRMPVVSRGTSLATGAFVANTFPNDRFARAGGPQSMHRSNWAQQEVSSQGTLLQQMREAAKAVDWPRLFAERQTMFPVSKEWIASEERCNLVKFLCLHAGARRVLEIGACCGVLSLAIAETLPGDGTVVAVELDPAVVDVGKPFVSKSPHGAKVKFFTGSAGDYLAGWSAPEPFDIIIIDADKDCMADYVDTIYRRGLLSHNGSLLIDLTPYKGQPPIRQIKYGGQEQVEVKSGKEALSAMRAKLEKDPVFVVADLGGLLAVRRAAKNNEAKAAAVDYDAQDDDLEDDEPRSPMRPQHEEDDE